MRSSQLKTSTKITFANAFDAEFSLLLRERRSTTLLSMQEAALEVESNILASEKLKTKSDRDKKKQREELPSSSNPTESDPKLDEMTRTLKALTSEIAKLKWEAKQPNIPYQDVANKNTNQFRRPNNSLKSCRGKGGMLKIRGLFPLFRTMKLRRWMRVMTLEMTLMSFLMKLTSILVT
jgi:hypothetical protein